MPTFKELGYDVEYYIWAGLFAPKGTPEPVMKVLRDSARKAVEDPDFKNTMAKVNSPVHYLDAPEFAKYWAAEAKLLAPPREPNSRSSHLSCENPLGSAPISRKASRLCATRLEAFITNTR